MQTIQNLMRQICGDFSVLLNLLESILGRSELTVQNNKYLLLRRSL